MYSIIIPYKRSRTDELIYALRSLKNYKHKDLWIIGDKPNGLNMERVNYIPFRQTTNIAKNTVDILNIACETNGITDDFVFTHDDMYFMRPTDEIPVYHRGTYDSVIEKYQNRYANYYIRRMKQTNKYLKSIGVKRPLCYEMHVPFVFNKNKLRQIELDERYNKLSMYGNIHHIGGVKKAQDVKVRGKERIPNGRFASSHDNTFNSNMLGKKIREMFNEKGYYE